LQDSSKLLRCGVVTTAPVKDRMRVELQRLLRSNQARFSEPFVSRRSGCRDEIAAQLREYHFEVRETDSEKPDSRFKIWLTGKSFGKSDDLAICVQMACFWPATYIADGERCLVRS
jgi:hypothetical protein